MVEVGVFCAQLVHLICQNKVGGLVSMVVKV